MSSPLFQAVEHNDPAAVEAVLAQHPEIVEAAGHDPDLGMCTPLMLAAFSGADRIEVVRVLLAHHADPNACSSEGATPLISAIEHGADEIVEALLAAGADIGVHEAAALGRLDLLEELLDATPTLLEARDEHRDATPVYYAACANRVGAIELLAGRGADLDAEDNAGWPPIIRAAFGQCDDAVELLLGLGANEAFETRAERWGVPAGSTVSTIRR